MNLFKWQKVRLHSGQESDWTIDCDDLTDKDVEALAHLIYRMVGDFEQVTTPASNRWSAVHRLATELAKVARDNRPRDWEHPYNVILVVDDVFTTGRSMEEVRDTYLAKLPDVPDMQVKGAVIFARGKTPDWIKAVWQLNEEANRAPLA